MDKKCYFCMNCKEIVFRKSGKPTVYKCKRIKPSIQILDLAQAEECEYFELLDYLHAKLIHDPVRFMMACFLISEKEDKENLKMK